MAPILSFTAHEASETIFKNNKKSIFTETWYQFPENLVKDKNLDDWKNILEIRGLVNKKIEELLAKEVKPFLHKYDKTSHLMLRIGIERLLEISKHYSRKENLFFPGIEKRGLTSIPKVMWGVDNDIRNMLKNVKKQLPPSMLQK